MSEAVALQYEDRSYALGPFRELLALMRPQDRTVLDIGCGAGDNARVLAGEGRVVHGVTLSERERAVAERVLARVTVADAEHWQPDYQPASFDALLFSHVLEHFVDPTAALRRLLPLLKPNGRVYIGLPNIAYWGCRLHFLRGRFDYADQGALDSTHLRFFTFHTAQAMVARAGLHIEQAHGVGHLPQPLFRNLWPGGAARVDAWAMKRWANLLGHSIVIVARPI